MSIDHIIEAQARHVANIQNAEAARVAAETTKADKAAALRDKATAEAAKVTAEADKATAEAATVTAEADKATAEAATVTAEADKVTAEAAKAGCKAEAQELVECLNLLNTSALDYVTLVGDCQKEFDGTLCDI